MTIERINDTDAANYEFNVGRLYIAPAGTSAHDTVDERFLAGQIVGKTDITVSENIHTVRDLNGNKVCDIHFGGKMEICGKLTSVMPESAVKILGAKRTKFGVDLSREPGARRLSACMVLGETETGETLTVHAQLATPSVATISFGETGGTFAFRLIDEVCASKQNAVISITRAAGGESA